MSFGSLPHAPRFSYSLCGLAKLPLVPFGAIQCFVKFKVKLCPLHHTYAVTHLDYKLTILRQSWSVPVSRGYIPFPRAALTKYPKLDGLLGQISIL